MFLVSFLPFSDVDPESFPATGRTRNMPAKNGRGSDEELYDNREHAIARAEALHVEWCDVYEAAKNYPLGRKLIWTSRES